MYVLEWPEYMDKYQSKFNLKRVTLILLFLLVRQFFSVAQNAFGKVMAQEKQLNRKLDSLVRRNVNIYF